MTRKRFNSQLSKRANLGQVGMTLLESLVAIVMLVVFTGVVTLVMQFTLRFFSAAESGDRNDLIELLSQPGITLDRLKGKERCSPHDPPSSCEPCTDASDERCRPQIAFDLGTDPQVACPAARPVTQWLLPMPEVSLPPGYRLCVWETTAIERSLASEDPQGIYLLQALPEVLSSASLPTRRLFCRPRPFC